MLVLGLIPARGGSQGIPRKNLAPLGGRPLLAWTVDAARGAARVSRVVVSTDDPAIAAAARDLGAEAPFLRPADLARDDTPALPVIQHALAALDAEGWRADAVCYLQPTSPLRRAEHVDAALALLEERGADSVVSVVPVPHQYNPVSVLRLDGERLLPFLPDAGTGPLRRQDKPTVYARNGPAVLAATRRTLLEQGRLYGERTLPLLMDPADSVDVDGPEDLAYAEWLLTRRGRG